MKAGFNFANKIKFKIAQYKDEKILNNLIKNPSQQISQLAKSIEFISKNKALTSEEKKAIELINNLRENLTNSNDVVLVKDFGAGSPDSNLSKMEMDSGVDINRNVRDICLSAASPSKFGELIFRMVLNYKPARCLELGTNLGISGAYQLAALKINGKGELVTIEGSENLAKIASKNFEEMGYSNFMICEGRFKDVLSDILTKEKLFDFVFIDGHHDKIATKEYFEQIYPFLSDKSVLIFDDIRWNEGMSDVWKLIYEDKRIDQSIDIGKWGICYINKEKEGVKTNYQKISF